MADAPPENPLETGDTGKSAWQTFKDYWRFIFSKPTKSDPPEDQQQK